MAVITQVETPLEPEATRKECVIIVWTPLAAGDTGTPIRYSEFSDRSIHITGALAGSTASVQGSNDVTSPTNWFTLTDTTETDILKTVTDVGEQVLQATAWIRPIVTGGAATTVTFKLFLRRGRGRTL